MDLDQPAALVVTCGRGAVNALAEEIRALGLTCGEMHPTAVRLPGSLRTALRLNLWLRTAHRVLLEVAAAEADSPDDLYELVRALPWEEWLRPEVPFHLRGAAHHPALRDPRFALLRCKDAIADRFLARTGARPDSTATPVGAAVVALHWQHSRAQVFLDTSGVSLSNRGYRRNPWKAPLRETLAAAILKECGWPRPSGESLGNPMCGSGTLAIEAAWMAQNRAPGLGRNDLAFLRLQGRAAAAWKALQEEARADFRPEPNVWIGASDAHPQAVACARENARRAGVEDLIRFAVCDFRDAPRPPPPGLILMNPEYGRRLGQTDTLEPLYRAIGDYFKNHCQGLRAAVLTGNLALGRLIGLRPCRRVAIWNGDLECRLLEYELYPGTRDSRLLRKHLPPSEPQ